MKKLLLVFAAASFLIAGSIDARVPIGTLAGTVLDARGDAVGDAVVMIQTSDGLQPYGTHTDSTGHFRITRLETGQYDLRASSHGSLSEWTKRVMVHQNKTTVVLLRLPSKKA
jgi:hypothetical protein